MIEAARLRRLKQIDSEISRNCSAVHDLSGRQMLEHIASILQTLPSGAEWTIYASERDEDAAHDAYFHVARVRGDAVTVLLRMIFEARLLFIEEVLLPGGIMATGILRQIDEAFAALGNELFDDIAATRPVDCWTTNTAVPSVKCPQTRWIRGHQIFAALTQGLIFSLSALGRSIRNGDTAQTQRWAHASIKLLRGSGAAFLFTGDFTLEEYMAVVRPTMMPPASAVALSGLMSIDHRFLVQTMRDMRPALLSLHDKQPELHGQLSVELETVYNRHVHVCERFVGERPSLLTQRHAKKSGPSLIEQFKTLRMKAFHAPEVTDRCPATAVSSARLQTPLLDPRADPGGPSMAASQGIPE